MHREPPPTETVIQPLPGEPPLAEPSPAEPPADGAVAQAPPAEAGMPPEPTPAPVPESDSYGPVKRGDTLSKIAREYKADDVTRDRCWSCSIAITKLIVANNRTCLIRKV